MISLDPGKLRHGLALWSASGALVEAGWFPVDELPPWGLGHEVVVETQVARSPQQTPGGQAGYQDLIDVAWEAGRFLGRFDPRVVRRLKPEEWKGQVPKPKKASEPYIIEARVRGILSPAEWKIVEAAFPSARGKRHNVVDAVGIGLFALGRCGRGVTRRGE